MRAERGPAMLAELGYGDVRTFRQAVKGLVKAFRYSTPLTTVGANLSQQATVQTEQASTFWCTVITGSVLLTANSLLADFKTGDLGTIVAMPDVSIFDSASDARIMDRDNLRFKEVVGNGEYAFRLAQPHPFSKAAVITVVYNNNSATSLICQVTFSGYKTYGR